MSPITVNSVSLVKKNMEYTLTFRSHSGIQELISRQILSLNNFYGQ